MKPGAGQGSPLRVAPGVPLGMGGDPEPCTERYDGHYYIVWGRCPTSRLPSHGHRLHMPYQGCEGTPDWVDVLALGRKRRLRSSRFVLVIRWTAAGRRGAGGRCCGAVHRQGCVRPLAAQVPAVQGVHGQFIDRVLDTSVAQRGVPTVQTVQKAVLASTSL